MDSEEAVVNASIAGTAGSILGSLAVVFAAGIAAMVVTIVVAIKRRNGS